MGATKLMVIRHAEKPGVYDQRTYSGVDEFGTVGGAAGAKHLATLGWQRAGALITLFAPPWGPKPPLATPKFLFASDPDEKPGDDAGDGGPSRRPYETLTTLRSRLNLTAIDTTHRKGRYAEMVRSALACDGAVLIAWQHEDIALTTKTGLPGISAEILTQTQTKGTFNVPVSWPTAPTGARYDLVFVFDRPSGEGPITAFTLVPQQLLSGDLPDV
jgi:hypothetical protein